MSEFGTFTGHEIIEEFEPPKPLIDKLLDYGDRALIAAKRKQGKTVLVFQLICSLTSGKPFLGIYEVDKPCRVLYLQGEMTRAETGKRLRNMMKQVPLELDNFFVYNVRGLGLQTSHGAKKALDDIKKFNIAFDVVIVDPLYRFMHGGNLNDLADVTTWVNNFDVLTDTLDAHTAIFIHHESEKTFTDKNGNKHSPDEGALFGSSIWGAYITQAYKLTSYKGIHKLRNPPGLQRSGENIDEIEMKMVTPQKDKLGRLFFEPYITHGDKEKVEIKLKNKLMYEKRCLYPDVYEDLGISCSYFHKLISEYEAEGKVIKERDEHGKKWYVWKE